MAVLQGLMPAYGEQPRICLLDEPSEGLDEESVQTLVMDIATLRARGHAFIIATHDARMRNKAKLLGEQIRAEDGVGTAIKAVYRDLEYARTLVERRAGTAGATKEPGSESWTFVGEEGESEAEEDES